MRSPIIISLLLGNDTAAVYKAGPLPIAIKTFSVAEEFVGGTHTHGPVGGLSGIWDHRGRAMRVQGEVWCAVCKMVSPTMF